MIHYIKGKVTQTLPGKIIIENNGIGYLVSVADNSPAYLALPDEEITLYTYMAVKEDDISLYGFNDYSELAIFNLLISVSGIGCKGAMSILSKLSVSEIKQACVFEDAQTIAKANGIGKKTAERIVLELKDKFKNESFVVETKAAASVNRNNAKQDALNALMALGFSKSEAMTSLATIEAEDLSSEEYIRLALKSRR